MLLSAKTQNACLAALELAKRYDSPQPVCLKTIAKAQNVSSQFLVQILLQLKRAGLVLSTRGASGGYRLAKSPADISLLDVITAIDGCPEPTPSNDTPVARVLFDSWSTLVRQHRQQLSEQTLESLCEEIESPAEDMYYI